MRSYDLAIIGSGPGGYVSGLYASRNELKVCVIEKDLVGGTCLNKGCIPTKSLINSASIFGRLKDAQNYGVDIDGYHVNFQRMMLRKDEVVTRLRAGIETLFKANKIDLIRQNASLKNHNTISLSGSEDIEAKYIVIAAGSKPAKLAGTIVSGEAGVMSSDEALSMKELPKSITIVGGGVIGCEFASLFNLLGVNVAIVEFMDRLIPGQSREASKKLEVIFKKRGIGIFLSSKVEGITGKDPIKISVSGGKLLESEKVLISVGRQSATEGLGLENAGVKVENGKIVVDEYLRANSDNTYAIGDCISGPLLAHKASYDGMLACDNILGKKRMRDYSNVPNCIWTDPEISSVGLTEEEARKRYPDLKIAKFPYLASGKAYLRGSVEGYIKLMGDPEGNIAGVEIMGEGACDLIGEATLARTAGVKIDEWSHVVHGHPTLSEIFHEATHIFAGTPIHGL
ncbi:MAG: dihydrolipoyl dehydrogenase [Candidatus Omnitrophota bacterium]|jgi:dihydrolipoamide dehydrogenase